MPGAQVRVGKHGRGGAECPDFLLAVDKAPDFSLKEIKLGQEELRDEFFERIFEGLEQILNACVQVLGKVSSESFIVAQ